VVPGRDRSGKPVMHEDKQRKSHYRFKKNILAEVTKFRNFVNDCFETKYHAHERPPVFNPNRSAGRLLLAQLSFSASVLDSSVGWV
jgi:hypothetical protein